MESTINLDFFIRLIINTVSVLVLIRLYYSFSRHRENAASFILFGTGVFLVTALLHSAEVTMGFAFGLFAVFSMLRYRTEALGIKEMTYLFLVIAMALLGAVGAMQHHELIALNTLIIALALVLETRVLLPLIEERDVEYEKIENIHPDRRQALLEDLSLRTGLDVLQVEVISISFLRDTAQLRLHYRKKAVK
ncbi:DUF4956 domain-containing protein [Hahella sp. CCB-MM4]|uniref:DUF4956 domain-containing protein n=1 Tax=Hahella sp. (strain CCB-MM4) TaxID=1926491 RepID=UPI000B9C2B39|nr:DUF4956 domain-containing protein [Hahella sp. CCB-MM4]OZG71732.1 DUF4956 domain-containing protein [Hahella sp. CCB-MM4]